MRIGRWCRKKECWRGHSIFTLTRLPWRHGTPGEAKNWNGLDNDYLSAIEIRFWLDTIRANGPRFFFWCLMWRNYFMNVCGRCSCRLAQMKNADDLYQGSSEEIKNNDFFCFRGLDARFERWTWNLICTFCCRWRKSVLEQEFSSRWKREGIKRRWRRRNKNEKNPSVFRRVA